MAHQKQGLEHNYLLVWKIDQDVQLYV